MSSGTGPSTRGCRSHSAVGAVLTTAAATTAAKNCSPCSWRVSPSPLCSLCGIFPQSASNSFYCSSSLSSWTPTMIGAKSLSRWERGSIQPCLSFRFDTMG
uniref:Uncharacterized protein n=1 Tax=Rhizophora mucronata TaxID=61149 RepID=A0A2P2IWU4_RHIMU